MTRMNKMTYIANATLCIGAACRIDPISLALLGAGLNLLAAAFCRS